MRQRKASSVQGDVMKGVRILPTYLAVYGDERAHNSDYVRLFVWCCGLCQQECKCFWRSGLLILITVSGSSVSAENCQPTR